MNKITSGKQSLSKTNACRSCPVAKGIIIQLPHHHGLLPNQPSLSNALYANSAARVAKYIAIEMRNWSPGYTPSANPAMLAPIAGARREVRVFAIRGFRWRNVAASRVRRLARRRVKKRKKRRWRRRISERARERRKLGYLLECFGLLLN